MVATVPASFEWRQVVLCNHIQVLNHEIRWHMNIKACQGVNNGQCFLFSLSLSLSLSLSPPYSDVWSLGVILFMLISGHSPFAYGGAGETLTRIMDGKYQVPTHVSDLCKQ